MWPPLRLKSVTPRGATRSASLSGATSAPALLRPLGHMPGYERSLTLLTNRHEGTETTERTARLQRPRPDCFVNVPPKSTKELTVAGPGHRQWPLGLTDCGMCGCRGVGGGTGACG